MTPAPRQPRRPQRSRLGSLGHSCSRNPRRIQPSPARQRWPEVCGAAPGRNPKVALPRSAAKFLVLRNQVFPVLLALVRLLVLRLGVLLRGLPVAVLVLPLALVLPHREIGVRLDVFLLS